MSIHWYCWRFLTTDFSLHTGSENNSLYLYYKGLSKTLLTFKFDTVKSVLDKDKKEDDTNEFVSAVCWRALPDGVSLFLYVHLYFWACTKSLVEICIFKCSLLCRSQMYWLLQTVKEQSRFVHLGICSSLCYVTK